MRHLRLQEPVDVRYMGAVTTLSIEQRLRRLDATLGELALWEVRDYLPLDDWRFDGQPLELGGRWPEPEGLHVLSHPGVELPSSWPLEETFLELDFGGESLLRVDYPNDSPERFGVDPNHRRFPIRHRRLSLEAEAVPRFPFGNPNRDPHLSVARLVWLDAAVESLHRRLRLVVEAARAVDSEDAARALVGSAEQALAGLDWPSATRPYIDRIAESEQMQSLWALPRELDPHPPPLGEAERATVTAATDNLGEELKRVGARYPKQGSVALTGHAHLDLAWLWPLEETARKARRTFSTAVGLLDRYSEFRFNQSSAQIYELVETDDPDLFEHVRAKIAAGVWEPIGGMWVEPDANMTAGESLVRQLLYGQRYFAEKFGFTHSVCWMPDCFGFTPALPQLLLGAGIRDFFTIKLTWSETNRFPYDLFWWEGLDGSRVLAHLFDNPGGGYNGDTGPLALLSTWRNYRGKPSSPETLLSVGWGDGGGGPTAEMLEQARETALLPAVPEARFRKVAEFYDETRRNVEATSIPTWVGELYLEYHRGTLTTQGRIKYLHRRAEHELVAAELVGALDALLGGAEPASLAAEWKVLLRNEFHDILPGSSIREVYELAEAELRGVGDDARAAVDDRLDGLVQRVVPAGDAKGLFVVNAHLTPQPLRVELGSEVPGAQRVEDGYVLTGGDEIGGLEARAIITPTATEAVRVSENTLENEFVRVVLADDGALASVYDKVTDREVLAGRGNQLWAYVDKPRKFDAWDIDPDYAEQGEELAPGSVEVVEAGPHRGAIRIERRHRDSRIRQDVRLWANSARVELRTTLDWHDRRLLLKARFPLAVRSAHATFETAFGIVERATHRNTSWDSARFEVAGHRFADLSEPGYGVALVNDGKYGHHALGNELGISLVRSPVYPDPLADEGEQTFTYALYPHRGHWLEGGVLREAQELNRPLFVRPVITTGADSWQPLRLDGIHLGLGALKVLEDGGGFVLRAYEPQGARGRVEPSSVPGWTFDAELNLLEEEIGPPEFAFAPFQVRSWRLRATKPRGR
jgi:alpha-mannosidase